MMSAGMTQSVSLYGEGLFATSNTIGARFQNATVAAFIGGTTSVITGGSFVDGAILAVYSRLFNDKLRRDQIDKEFNEKQEKFKKKQCHKALVASYPDTLETLDRIYGKGAFDISTDYPWDFHESTQVFAYCVTDLMVLETEQYLSLGLMSTEQHIHIPQAYKEYKNDLITVPTSINKYSPFLGQKVNQGLTIIDVTKMINLAAAINYCHDFVEYHNMHFNLYKGN